MHTHLRARFIGMPCLLDGLQNSLTVGYSCTDPSHLLPTSHPLDTLAITLSPQLSDRLLKVCFSSYPYTYYLSFYGHVVELVSTTLGGDAGEIYCWNLVDN